MRVLLTLSFILFYICSQAQFNRDTIILNDGTKISCTIGRIGMNNFMYSTGEGYKKIKKDKVSDYKMSDRLFYFNENKEIEYELIVEVPGNSKDEIYRAIKDWVWTNRNSFWSGNLTYKNKEKSIFLGTMYSRNFYDIDLLSLLEVIAGEDISYYTFHYYIGIRVKDQRLKIYYSNLNLVNSRSPQYDRNASELFRRRVNKDGTPSKNMKVILKIQKMLMEQVDNIKSHIEYVKNNKTWEENTINWFLEDNNW